MTTIEKIHERLKFTGGSLKDELPEQLMSLEFIKSDSTVLELGGNIGRNSCVISSILDDSSRLVVLETNTDDAKILAENRDMNGFKFNIENCAISTNTMYQYGWNCIETNFQPGPEWVKVKTVPWAHITERYNKLKFDTLVADCEGGLFYILYYQEYFIDSFKTIIVENDYLDYNKKLYVDQVYRHHGFRKVFEKEGCIGGTDFMIPDFYAVWKKD